MGERIIVYTDGSVIDNGSEQSKCGWAVKLMHNGKAMLKSGKVRGYTNNQTEMYAVFKAMQSIHDKKVPVTILEPTRRCGNSYLTRHPSLMTSSLSG